MGDPARPDTPLVARRVCECLPAYLAYRWRDIAAAEDALADAFAAALQTWPERGVPDAPEVWLMTVARHKLEQMHRHAVALAESGAVAQALHLLDAIDGALVTSYQPYWVARSHLLALDGQYPGAASCCQRALGLTTQPGVRSHLQVRLQMLQNK